MSSFDTCINGFLPSNRKSPIRNYIRMEQLRQENNVELIASENFCSDAIRAALGSCLTNKYAEGYPSERDSGLTGRYYGGCQYIDIIEQYCCDAWREVFKTKYHVNVQPHSGTQANMAAYAAVLKPGDTILALSLSSGGHLSHGSPVNFSGKLYNIISYGLDKNGFIDYYDLEQKIIDNQPKLVLAGASAYSREINFKRIKEFINRNAKDKMYFMVDMAHIAGLVAAGQHQSPFGVADIITTTSQKTLRGPRGGLIFCVPELAKKIDSAVFPGNQGGPLPNVIAAKAICAEEALEPEFTEYIKNVVLNCEEMCNTFIKLGYNIVTGGTDNHLFLIDLTDKNITGKQVQDELEKNHITLNKNCVPNETRSPKETSGVRIGTAAMTTLGWTADDFIDAAFAINDIIKKIQ